MTHNKKGFFAVGKTPLSNNNYGATLGGPVIRNKTFFFGNFDYTRLRSGVLPGFGNTTPTDAFKAGDFSALLTGNQIGTDALGRPIFGGQICCTTRQVNGVSFAIRIPVTRFLPVIRCAARWRPRSPP